MRKNVTTGLISCLSYIFICAVYGQDLNLVKEVSFEDLADKTKVVITTEQPAQYRFFRLLNPERIEVKVLNAEHRLEKDIIPVNKGSVERIRLEQDKLDAEEIVRVLIYCQSFASYHILREKNKIIVEIIKPVQEEVTPPRAMQAKKYYEQGNQYYKKGDYSEALAAFKQALEINPDYPEAQGYLAQTQAKVMNLEKKEELARLKAVAEDKTKEQARTKGLQAKGRQTQKTKEEQQEEAAKRKEKQKRLFEHFKLGQTYYKKQMFQEARKEFESALREDPKYKKVQDYLFRCKKRLIELEQEWIRAEQRKREEEAERLAQDKDKEEREKKSQINKYWNAGNKYWQKGDFLKAGDEWSKLLSIEPTFDKIDHYILPEELERFAQSGQMSEEELEAFHNLAQIRNLYWQAQDKARQGQAEINKQIKRHYQLGAEYYKNGYWQDAMLEFQKLLKLDPKQINAQKLFLESRIKFMEDEKRKRFVEIGAEEKIRQEAQREAKEKQSPQTKEMQDELKEHYRLAKIYYREGNFKNAASEFKQVLEIDPLHTPASQMLAMSEKEIVTRDTEGQIQLARREYERASYAIFQETPWGKTKLALGLSGSISLKTRYINSSGAKDENEFSLDRNIDLNFRKTLAKNNHFLLNLGTQESNNDDRDTKVKSANLNYRRDKLIIVDTGYHQSENNWLDSYNKSLTYTDSHLDLRTDVPNIPKLHARYEKRTEDDKFEPATTEYTTRTYQLDATHKIGPTQFWVDHLVRKFKDGLNKIDDTDERRSLAKVRIALTKFLSFFQEYQTQDIEKENNSDWGYQTDTWTSNLNLSPLKNLTIKTKYINKQEYDKLVKVDTNWITLGAEIISHFFERKLALNFGYYQQNKNIDTQTATDKDSKKIIYSGEARLRPWKDLLSLSFSYENEDEEYDDPLQSKAEVQWLRSSLSLKPVKSFTLSTWYTISERKYKYRASEVLTTSFYYQGQFTGLQGRFTLDSGFRIENIRATDPSDKLTDNNKSVNANFRYKFTPRFNLSMNGRYTWFNGTTDYNKTDISSSIEWKVFDNTRLGLGYSFINLDSSINARDYTAGIYDLTLRTIF